MTSTRVSRERSFLVSYSRAVSRERLSGTVSRVGRARAGAAAARERPSRRGVVVRAICISSSTGQREILDASSSADLVEHEYLDRGPIGRRKQRTLPAQLAFCAAGTRRPASWIAPPTRPAASDPTAQIKPDA